MGRSLRPASPHVGMSALIAVVLLLAGCDFFGVGTARPAHPSFTMANDLALRTTVLGSASNASSSETRSAAVSLTPVVQVTPPTVKDTRTQAGQLSYDPATERLHVGYKLAGSDFGGGIDILDVHPGGSAEDLVDGYRSLRSTNVDVMEVRSHTAEGALYAAGAVTTQKQRLSPAVVSKIIPSDSEIVAQSKRLSHNVAKSLVLGPAPNTVHVATDENTLFQFDLDLNNQSKLTAGGTSGFRSATAHEDQVFVLDQSGHLFSTTASTFQSLSSIARLTESAFGNGTVARLHTDGDQLYAALNEKGFAIVAPSGTEAWTSDPVPPEARYTCVSTGPSYVYVGRFDGAIEVYERPETIAEGPEHVGTFGPWAGTYGGRLSGAPINQILVIENHLYVAHSRDGMVVFRIDEN